MPWLFFALAAGSMAVAVTSTSMLLMVLCLATLPALADTTACDFGDFVWELTTT